MATSLGGATHIVAPVKNVHTVAIKKGQVVMLPDTAPFITDIDTNTQTADFGSGTSIIGNKQAIINVLPIDSADDNEPGSSAAFGIAVDEIAVGEFGTVCLTGICDVLMHGTPGVGSLLTHNADAEAIPGSDALVNVFGILVETAVADETSRCFVNFFNRGVTANSAYQQTTKYYGLGF